MRAFTIVHNGIIDGIHVGQIVTRSSRCAIGISVGAKRYDTIIVDEKTFGAQVSRIFRAQVAEASSTTKKLIHDPGIEDKRGLLLIDIPGFFLGSTAWDIQEKGGSRWYAIPSRSNGLFQILVAGNNDKNRCYLAIVQPNTIISIVRVRGKKQAWVYIQWNGDYPRLTHNKQEIFGPDPFSRFLPEQYETVL